MHASGEATTISYQQIEWSPVATIPEGGGLPLQFPLDPKRFSMPSGRSGDMLVVQIRSEIGETKLRRDALRSLGLNGVRSSSIRSSFEEGVFGYIRTVRDLIAVARLNAVVYKSASSRAEDMAVDFERIEYGTSTRPGGLIRSSLGDYFTFESDRKGLLLNWSTDLSAEQCVHEFRASFPDVVPDGRHHSSVVGIVANGVAGDESIIERLEVDRITDAIDEDHALDPSALIVDLPTPEAIDIVSSQKASLVVARLGFVGLELIWHRQYARFIDSDNERAEVGIYTRDYSYLDGVRVLARRTGKNGFFDAVPVTAQIRERGIAKHVRI